MAAFAIGAGIAAAASIGGQYLANQQARGSVNRQIAFQREAYQSRYQWQTADMRRAGINPILSYSQGPPAAPVGASYQPQSITSGVKDAINSAVAAYQASDQKEAIQAGTDQSESQAKLNEASTATEVAKQQNIWADTQLKNAQAVHESVKLKDTTAATNLKENQTMMSKWNQIMAETRAELLKSGLPEAKLEEELYKTTYGKWLKWIERTGRAILPVTSAGRNAR